MDSEFEMGQSAGQKLVFAFRRNKCASAELEWLSAGVNMRLVGLLARGEAELVMKTVPTSPTPETEVEVDPIVRVDRSVRPSYPDWMKEVMHPELETTGPAEYDISEVEQWLHDGQKDGKYIEGNKIYKHLKETNTLKTCLGLRDLEEIQKKGIVFFRKYFKGKTVFGWRSIVRRLDGHLNVQCLYERGDNVVLSWYCTVYDWDCSVPALRHVSNTKA